MSRLSIRLRLTLAFTLAMAVVLAGVGAFLYVRLGDSLEEQLEESLEVRGTALAALLAQRDGEPAAGDLSPPDDEELEQVLGADGAVRAASSPAVAQQPLLDAAEAERARAGPPFFVRRVEEPLLDDQAVTLYAVGLPSGDVLVAGATHEDIDDALTGLLAQLLVVGPLALLLAGGGGYLLAAAALRPVESMRRRAMEVSADEPGRRLPLPRARDEVRRLGETLNEMLARLEAGLERERRFVADASHELRTPLALLQAELELALRRPRTSEELEQALRSAAEDADRLARLAEDLLALARLQGGKLPLRTARVSPPELLETVARRFAARAADAERRVEVRHGDAGELNGDPERLEQALGNLVDNALRHGGGTVTLSAARANGAVALSVADQGTGFPPGYLEHAFEPFSQANEARSGGGAGLGLAIVDAIARAHGGAVSAANSAAGGAVVTLTLPSR